MTRINVVPVQELCDQHLLAEHREITRIPNGVITGKLSADYPDMPTEYVLGPGHVKFFTNKLMFLRKRYFQLFEECRLRNFHVNFNFPDQHYAPLCRYYPELLQDYIPTEAALAINRERIRQRMPATPRFTPNDGTAKLMDLDDY